MLNTLPQWLLFVIFIGIGILSGILIGIIHMIHILLGKRKWMQILCDIISCLIITIVYIICINAINWGESRLFLVIAYLIGIYIERKTLGKLFAKLYHKLYNLIVNRIDKISKSKFGAILKR